MIDRVPNDDSKPRPNDPPPRQPNVLYNPTSLIGMLMVAVGLAGVVFYFIADLMSGHDAGYGSVMMLPPFAVLAAGVALVPLGRVAEARRRARGAEPILAGKWTVDLEMITRVHPSLIILVTAGVSIVMLGLGAGSMKAIGFTESNTFCGTVCHTVMSPEYTAYQDSPHAHIDCVECHVGHGAESYIRAKISGLRQVYGVATGTYQRPIPTPLHGQRPARDMCESCHWPERFIDYKAITRSYYLSDEESTAIKAQMLMKVGGGQDALIEGSGIHHHMFIAKKVEYIARDEHRQDIPWVRVTNEDGDVKVFNNTDTPLTEEEIATLPKRVMDCLDCHNRPAHNFEAPMNSVNRAIGTGLISRELPYVKLEAVRALDAGYETTDAAMKEIPERLRAFYEENHPDVAKEHAAELDTTIDAVKMIYQRTIFPEMKADWSAHQNNIGHRDSRGCFRCHNDEMENEEGDAIFTTCNKCHVILTQTNGHSLPAGGYTDFAEGQAFVHPEDSDTIEEYTACTDCHTGGIGTYE